MSKERLISNKIIVLIESGPAIDDAIRKRQPSDGRLIIHTPVSMSRGVEHQYQL